MMSLRPVYVLSYDSPLFPAHWAIFLPSFDPATQTSGTTGKQIHVTGDSLNGFTLDFKRNYNPENDSRKYHTTLLGYIDTSHIIDGVHECDEEIVDSVATDTIEEWAAKYPAPGPSLRKHGEGGKRSRVAIQNCQSWLKEFVAGLVEGGMLSADATENIEKVPRN